MSKQVWIVNTAVLRGRARPVSGKVLYRRPRGFKLGIVKTAKYGSDLWGQTQHGTWYSLRYCRRYVKGGSSSVISPTPGVGVTYPYGIRNSRYVAGFHTGADHAAGSGHKIVSVCDGTVIRADWGGAYGNWTLVRGKVGGSTHTFLYAHQSRRAVRVGQKVKAGQVIGYVGSTGNVTGPHLHHEMSRGSSWAYASVQNPHW